MTHALNKGMYCKKAHARAPNGLPTRIIANEIPMGCPGAEIAGLIAVDMTFLKTEGYIQPRPPSEYSRYDNPKQLHWDVVFDLVMIVDGRNLYYEARWPPLDRNGAVEQPLDRDGAFQQRAVQPRGQICIAPAFEPGTA